jgi:hypothetical protein
MTVLKKSWLAIFVVLLNLSSLKGQIITTDPALPVPGKIIKIFYDSSKDAGDLHNSTADLYAHTGLTLSSGGDWQKVIGTWGNNTSQPKLKYLGNYLYELDITPDLKTFYSLSTSDVVTKISLVIRNSTATLQTRPDIFIDVFPAGLNVQFTLPARKAFVSERDKQINIKVAAASADSVSLYINNKYIKSVISADQLTYDFLPENYGDFLFKVIAWDLPDSTVDSSFCHVRNLVLTEPLPPGLKDGINYTSNTSATLVLYAPYKEFVFATGDFTNWRPTDKGYMKRTPDGERYWIDINYLVPGKEYRFQYYVDTTLYIADPYSEKVLDPSNDQYISSATYPGLIPYPTGIASGIVSVLQTSAEPYQWQTTGFQPPGKSKLTIYELLVRDFTAAHNYKTLIDTLGYLQNLGVSAIELMPVNEFEGNLSWGYNPSFYFAPDKYYGPANDLRAFVDSCHNRGIAVIIDMVLNHCFGQSPFVQLYKDHDGDGQIIMKTPNPWFNASSPNSTYKWGADFNHSSPSTQAFVDRITSYWLTEYKVDGFRFDFTKGFTNTPGDGGGYDASRIEILKRMANNIWKVNPDAYVILEHFAANSEEAELADYGMMLWGNINYNYAEAAMGYASNITEATSIGRSWKVPNLVSYMESHDEERLMYKTITYGASTATYNTRELTTALRRMKLDALFFLTVPGPKMIWQFGELGYDISIENGGRTGEKPIKWDYFNDYERHKLFLFYKLLIYLRKTQPVLGTTDYSYSLSGVGKQLLLNDPDIKVNILGNFGITPVSVNPAFPVSGKWYEYFSGDSINVTDANSTFEFQPGEYRLYSTKKLPSSKLIIGIHDTFSPEGGINVNAYPNPSSYGFRFELTTKVPVRASVLISDISGKVIKKGQTDNSSSTEQSFFWDGNDESGIPAAVGIYLAQFRTSSGWKTVKVLKI